MRKCKGRCDMELGDVTHHNVMQLKRVNQVVFPVSYNDKFYKDVVSAGELAKLAYFNDIVIGGVCCRIDTSNNKRRMYIMTLGCLAPYRRFGLGTLMLDHVFALCEKDPTIESIFLHVQVSNESALDFYRRFGFEVVETAENYYKRIDPTDAYVLEKRLLNRGGGDRDHGGHENGPGQGQTNDHIGADVLLVQEEQENGHVELEKA